MYKTNDIVNLIDTNRFEWLGRIDNVINSAGVKIHPEQVETRIAHLIPQPFYIAGVEDEKMGQKCMLFIEKTGMNMDTEDLWHRIRGILPKMSVPRGIIWVDKIPTTSSGKIIRQR